MKRYLFYIITLITVITVGLGFYKLNNKSTKPTLRVKAINFDAENQNDANPFLTKILEENYNLKFVNKNEDVLLNGCLSREPITKDPKVIKIYYTSELYTGSVQDQLQTQDLVLGFDYIDQPNYIRFPFSYHRHKERMRHDYDRKRGECNPSEKKYFACFLASNDGEWLPTFDGARERAKLFHRLSLYKKVLSGGKLLNNIGERVSFEQEKTEDWLSQCKFTIAYENQYYPGYITEKAFQAWFAGSIPIYNADRSVLEDINSKAVIFGGDFSTQDELVDYIKKVDNDDELYCSIWNQRILVNPEKDYEVLIDKVRKKINEIFETKFNKKI
jgi:hypothetical protein